MDPKMAAGDPAAKAATITARTSANAEAAAGSQMRPPTEPIDPSTFNTFVDTLGRAYAALSGGEFPLKGAPKASAPLEEIPPPVAAAVAALGQALPQFEGGDAYAIGPDSLTSNRSITELTTDLDAMAGDEALIAAMSGKGAGKKAPPEPKAEPKGPTEDVDDLMADDPSEEDEGGVA